MRGAATGVVLPCRGLAGGRAACGDLAGGGELSTVRDAAITAVDRGYAFAALDGPGQGAMLYDQRVPMRPDWENVVPAMFDAVTAHPEADPERVALVGRSFGGLIAPRAAAGEHRSPR